MQQTARHLAAALRHHGINATLDQFHSLECADAPVEWTSAEISRAKFVIVILSEHYPLCLAKAQRYQGRHYITEFRLSSVEADILQGEILEGRRNFVLPVVIGLPLPTLAIPEVFKQRTVYFLDEQFSNEDWQKLLFRLLNVERFSDNLLL